MDQAKIASMRADYITDKFNIFALVDNEHSQRFECTANFRLAFRRVLSPFDRRAFSCSFAR